MQSILASELLRVKTETGAERKIWRKTVVAAPPAALAAAAQAPATAAAAAGASSAGASAAPSKAAPTSAHLPDAATAALRAAGLPVRLFGETEAQRYARAGVPYSEGSGSASSSGSGVSGGGGSSSGSSSGSDGTGASSRKRARQEEAETAATAEEGGAQAAVAAPVASDDSTEGRVRFAPDVGGAAGGGAGGADAAGGVDASSFASAASTTAAAAAAPPAAAAAAAAPAPQRKRSHLDALPFAPSQPGGGDAHRFLYKFWHGLLCEWEAALGARAPAHAASALGRAEAQSAAQTRDFMAPFFRLCQNRTVPPDLLPLCCEFAGHLLAREYMAGGDAYLRLAVGKAQWLMGVSQVGLHERAARERIYIGKLPHVMNDETQRRYLTAMKKLMTILQDMCPPEDASKIYAP